MLVQPLSEPIDRWPGVYRVGIQETKKLSLRYFGRSVTGFGKPQVLGIAHELDVRKGSGQLGRRIISRVIVDDDDLMRETGWILLQISDALERKSACVKCRDDNGTIQISHQKLKQNEEK